VKTLVDHNGGFIEFVVGAVVVALGPVIWGILVAEVIVPVDLF